MKARTVVERGEKSLLMVTLDLSYVSGGRKKEKKCEDIRWDEGNNKMKNGKRA